MKANYCTCESDSVRLDIQTLLNTPGAQLTETILKKYITADLLVRGKRMALTNAPKPKPEAIVLPNPKCQLCVKGASDMFPLLQTEPDKFVHKVCAQHVLEPQVTEDVETNTVKITGIELVPVGRWKLVFADLLKKCSVCKIPAKLKGAWVGACIQCTCGKCIRAWHVTCAIQAGIPVSLDENGYLVALCSAHDPVKCN
jgi:PHD-zinc-finger like domain